MGRRRTQATGQKGPHEGGGGIAHQSTACIPTGTKVRRENIVTIRVDVHCGHTCDRNKANSAAYLDNGPPCGVIKPGPFDRCPGKMVSE